MANWTIDQLLEATQGELVGEEITGTISRISIDSRRIIQGEAFVAIRGMRYDGHQFIEDAVHRGAGCLIVSHLPSSRNGCASVPTILVEDTTEALGALARYHCNRLSVPVVAVTGSCGKTTTKDLVAHLLGGNLAVHKSCGTQNNHIGVPLTLLGLEKDHEMVVMEFGSNHPGEIAYLASIAQPSVAVVTNVGPSHLQFFGSLMEVLHEKLSILEGLRPEGTVVLPGDQLDVCLEAQQVLPAGMRVVTFGATERCDIQATEIKRCESGMAFRLRDHVGQWTTHLMGYHNVENALAALACTWSLGIPLSSAKRRLSSFEPIPLRSQLIQCNGLCILNDCYNANPLSFARALETLRDMVVRRRVAIVGDMLELGAFAASAHRAIGRLATQMGIDSVVAVGEHAGEVAQGVKEVRPGGILTYQTVPELIRDLPSFLRDGDGVLVKGSRKLNLEQVTESILARYQGAPCEFTG